jgi:prolyl-tRNA editing enzyme YbaK/EbsC (Cys-tRNA(Pro) deacylase)
MVMVLMVEGILDGAGVEYRVMKLTDRAVSVDDVIQFSKGEINPSEICKTIIVKAKTGFTALFLRGSDRVNFKKLKGVTGKARIASHEDVMEVAGVMPGAVCPLLVPVPVIVDWKLFALDMVNFGSGDHLYGVEMRSADLYRVLDFTVADFTE